MTRRDLPRFVYAKVSRGKTYHRFIRGAVSQQVDPAAPDFWATYAKLMEGEVLRVPAKHTFSNLIADYRRDEKYRKRAARTKADYDKVLARIEKAMGDRDPGGVRKVNVVEWQRQLSGRKASYFVQVLSILMKHACDIGWRDTNPCDGVALKTPETKAAHVVWTDEAVAKFRAEAKPLPRLIFELGIGTAQRPADLTSFNWEDFDGAAIRMVQGKTGRELTIPCPAPLLAVLKRPKVMNLRGKTPILRTRAKRMTYRRMAEIMLAERIRLGVTEHDLHALRYRGVMELAIAGCSDDEIMAVSGHRSKAMVEKYAGIARQIMLAKAANAKREA